MGRSGTPSAASCVHRIHCGACAGLCDLVVSHPGMVRPRTTGRSIHRSTVPVRAAAAGPIDRTRATSSFGESWESSETRNASLHPHLTPSSGGPNAVSDSGTPAVATASNAFRTLGGTNSQGLPADPSKGRAAGRNFHRRTPLREWTAAAIRGRSRTRRIIGMVPGEAPWSRHILAAEILCLSRVATGRRPHQTLVVPRTNLRSNGWTSHPPAGAAHRRRPSTATALQGGAVRSCRHRTLATRLSLRTAQRGRPGRRRWHPGAGARVPGPRPHHERPGTRARAESGRLVGPRGVVPMVGCPRPHRSLLRRPRRRTAPRT